VTAGIKANVDGSAAIQVGGVDAITLTSAGAASFVTSPMTIQGGSAAAPSLTFSGDTNTGIFSPAADTIAFSEGGVESMRIDASGRLLIGGTSGSAILTVVGGTQMIHTFTGASAAFAWGQFDSSGNASINNQANANLLFATNNTERARIDSSGKLLVGTTSLLSSDDTGGIYWSSATGSGGVGGFEFRNTSTSTNSDPNPALVIIKGSTTYTSSQRFIQFNANNGLQAMGGIVGNGATNVQFISLSDVREKENIEPITGSLNKVVALNPVEFDWKKTGEHITAGFIAQEVESLFPEYVVDNVANAGEEERKGLTGGMSAGFIAHLVKAIQEQQQMIETLQAEVALLKGAA
jgi:hypothetical protein